MMSFSNTSGWLLCTIMVLCALAACESPEKNLAQDGEVLVISQSLIQQLPEIRFINSADGAGRSSDYSEPEAFNFSDSPDGVAFSSSADVTFIESPEGDYFEVDVQSLRNGGGVISAGDQQYDIDVAFCFSADDDVMNFTDELGNSIGLSGIIGISGFNKVQNLEELEGAENMIDAVVYLIVLDENARGKYKVHDGSYAERGVALAAIWDVQNEITYSSSRGSLHVGSNTMTFEGYFYKYYDSALQQQTEVAGTGTLGCE